MASALTRHSRLVFWLKIVLPILALAILSTMFLFARRIDFEGALPYAEVDIDALANDPRLTRPEFSGMTDDGAAITVAAATARPGKTANDPMTADEVIAVYQSESGKRITIQARTGSFGNAGNSLTLTGDVVVATSDGYHLRSQEMVSALDATEVTSEGPVNGTGPFGQLEAGGMKLSGASDDQTVVFNNGVRLIYQPKN
jgi:lipopolysaccharide export system protein LptC